MKRKVPMSGCRALILAIMWTTSAAGAAEPGRLTVQCEITQTIQDAEHSVPLLCGKATYARLYVSWTGQAPITVGGEITRTDARGVTQIIPSDGHLTVPAMPRALTVQRDDVQKSLNFNLGEPLSGGQTVEVTRLIDAATNETVEFDASACERNYTFYRAPVLRIRLLGIRFPYNDAGSTIAPSADDYALADSWLERAYPVADVITDAETIDSNYDWPFTCEDINSQMESLRKKTVADGGDPRVRYYGMVSAMAGHYMRGCAAGIPASPDAGIVASGPTNMSIWGYWDDDGSIGDWYAGHELGHVLGRSHVKGCGEGSEYLDTTYPIADARLGDSQHLYVGFDTGDDDYATLSPEALPGTDWHDVMSYCDYQWMSAHTFMGIYGYLTASEAEPTGAFKVSADEVGSGGDCPAYAFEDRNVGTLGATVDPGDAPFEVRNGQFISLTAQVDLEAGTAAIVSMAPLNRGIVSPRVFRSASDLPSLEIHQIDGAGNVIDAYPVRVLPSTDRSAWQRRTALASALIPLDPATRRIELRYGGGLADARETSDAAPVVSDVRIEQQEGAGQPAVLRWSSSDPDSNDATLTHTVRLSADGGRSFRTIASGTTRRQIHIDERKYARQRLLFEVIATDGFLTGSAQSDLVLIR